MARVEANGLEIEVDTIGDARHPAVLLVMGLGMQLVAWPDEFCLALARAGYHVIRFDNRDIGLSSRVDGPGRRGMAGAFVRYALGLPVRAPYRVEDMAEDAVGVLDALGIPAAHVIGASLGGMIAQALAAAHPQRCLSLTSIMSTSGARHLPWARPRVGLAMSRRPSPGASVDAKLDYVVNLFGVIGSPGFPTDPAQLRARLAAAIARNGDAEGQFHQLRAVLASGDRSAALATIRVPTLVLHGEDDPFVRVEHGRDCAAKIPDAKLCTIAGMGHDFAPSLMPVLAGEILAHLRHAAAVNAGCAVVRDATPAPARDGIAGDAAPGA